MGATVAQPGEILRKSREAIYGEFVLNANGEIARAEAIKNKMISEAKAARLWAYVLAFSGVPLLIIFFGLFLIPIGIFGVFFANHKIKVINAEFNRYTQSLQTR